MQVVRFSTLDPLAPLAAEWDRLARGVPFRGWAWSANWWRRYAGGPNGRQGTNGLFLLAVFDEEGHLAGIAPWYVEHSAAQGRVLRFLGSGEVASDYLSLPCRPEYEERVSGNLADWLVGEHWSQIGRLSVPDSDRWDLLELTGVDAGDSAVARLAAAMEARGNPVHRRPGARCWRIELPGTWDDYLAGLSKDHRKQVRRIQQRLLATGRAVLHTVTREDELPQAEQILVDLHQRRQNKLGGPGRFASERFASFHHDVMPELLREGQLGLHWIELDGKPVAAEYHLIGDDVVYAYQSGVDPDALDCWPGTLAHAATIRSAIGRGMRGFDFLRGDEPYKAHWRAQPRSSVEVRIAAAGAGARLRHGLWQAGSRVKRWLRRGPPRITQGQP
jgi:CelD/BcsL family acetyltransferase involved in cellulose biosynthesis